MAVDDPLAVRLAARWRVLILALGIAGGVVLAGRVIRLGPSDAVVIGVIIVVGGAAAGLFACAVFDGGFHRALSVVNAERAARARRAKGLARLFGGGPAVGDRALHGLAVAVLIGLLIGLLAAGECQDGLAVILGLATFFLVGLANIASLVRGRPTDRFVV